jgi:hypothetical protein
VNGTAFFAARRREASRRLEEAEDTDLRELRLRAMTKILSFFPAPEVFLAYPWHKPSEMLTLQ